MINGFILARFQYNAGTITPCPGKKDIPEQVSPLLQYLLTARGRCNRDSEQVRLAAFYNQHDGALNFRINRQDSTDSG